MNRPLSPIEVEGEITRLCERLDKVITEVAKRGEAAAQADVAYKVAHAKAFLAAEGPVAVREARATVATEDEYQARKIADALLHSAQEAGRATRSQLDALRTVAANLRAVT